MANIHLCKDEMANIHLFKDEVANIHLFKDEVTNIHLCKDEVANRATFPDFSDFLKRNCYKTILSRNLAIDSQRSLTLAELSRKFSQPCLKHISPLNVII